MKPGVSHRNRTGSPWPSHSCRKRAALSAPSASMAPPRWRGSLATMPSGWPSTLTSVVTIPAPNPARSSSEAALVGQAGDRRRGPRRAASAARAPRPAGRSGRAPDRPRRARRGSRGSAWRRRRRRPRRPPAGRPRRSAHCSSSGPMSSGAWTPSPPPSIIAGPPIPMFEPSVAMTTSQHPSRAALPAKHRPEVIPTSGTCPLSRAKRWNAIVSRPDTPGASVSPGRPPPPSAKSTTGRCWRSASSNRRSFLRWFWKPWVPARTV